MSSSQHHHHEVFSPIPMYHIPTSSTQKIQLILLLFGILLLSGMILIVLNSHDDDSTNHHSMIISEIQHSSIFNIWMKKSWMEILNEFFSDFNSYFIYYWNEIGRTWDYCLEDHDGMTSGSNPEGCFSRVLRPKFAYRRSKLSNNNKHAPSSSPSPPFFILFPKDIPSNYQNVTRVGKVPPKIRNGHHCPFNGFRKHTHYMFSQTILPTLCYHNIENDLYCDLTEVKENFRDRLSPHALIGFNKNRRVRSWLFAQCCDNFDFRFNFKKLIQLNSTTSSSLNILLKTVPKPILDQIYNSILMEDMIRYEDLPNALNWNTLNIQDFLHEKTKRLLENRWPDILYHHSRVLASLKFGMWAHAFTKFGTCVTGQIYQNYMEKAFSNFGSADPRNSDEFLNNIHKRLKLERTYHSDPELYFELIILLNSQLDYFKRKHGTLLKEYFPPSLNQTYSVREIKQRIQQLFHHDVLLTCVWSTKYSHRLLYQIHTCIHVQQLEELTFYLIEKRQLNQKHLKLFQDPTLKKLLSQIQPQSCSSIDHGSSVNDNRQDEEMYHHNATDLWNHWRYGDEPTLLHARECEDESQVLIPNGEEILKLFVEEPSSGKIIKISEEQYETFSSRQHAGED
ncbi:hypothetical protein C9374_005577 [Naegleria lovaniensis]|uniref:Uncharacterized protein n=1 Tax=Naegleria lovaniensis TaxID=51637 RepID=A0AA88GLE6_NAELO|nr:uncharacterized protein C9374_005577 [Naegleria lovaniensis]KAG2382375.1 hypothetical protein C9374_005577 [Naegleria lovaniensis]